jgi:hypothetical protein
MKLKYSQKLKKENSLEPIVNYDALTLQGNVSILDKHPNVFINMKKSLKKTGKPCGGILHHI